MTEQRELWEFPSLLVKNVTRIHFEGDLGGRRIDPSALLIEDGFDKALERAEALAASGVHSPYELLRAAVGGDR